MSQLPVELPALGLQRPVCLDMYYSELLNVGHFEGALLEALVVEHGPAATLDQKLDVGAPAIDEPDLPHP